MTEINVFNFQDYRAFLQASFESSKSLNPRWTYGAWAKRLGLKNSTSLVKIMNGSREAGPRITNSLIEYFEFSTEERAFFEDLIRLSKADKDPALKVLILDRLRRTHPEKEFQVLDHNKFKSISQWWHYALRKLCSIRPYNPNNETEILKQLIYKVQPKEIKKAFFNLEDLGLLKKNKNGDYITTDQLINTSDDVSSEALRQFHEGVLELAKTSIRKTDVKDREISGMTMAVSSQDLDKMKEFLRKQQLEFFKTFSRTEGADQVYQMETCFFPLTQKIKGEKES